MNDENHTSDSSIKFQKHLDQMQGNIIIWGCLILWAKVQGVCCLLGNNQRMLL